MMIVALSVLAWQASQSRSVQGEKNISRPAVIPAERYQLLARFEPPPASDAPELRASMDRYRNRDYSGAIALLSRQDSTEARYYLGICYLLSDNTDAGVRALRTVEGSRKEEARYYLAKGLLALGDPNGARAELEQVAATHGSLEKQARSLVEQIR